MTSAFSWSHVLFSCCECYTKFQIDPPSPYTLALLEIWKAWIGGCIAVVALSTDWMGGTITILLPPIQILSDQQECLRSRVFKGPLGIQHPSALQDKSSCDMASFKWTVGRQSTVPPLELYIRLLFRRRVGRRWSDLLSGGCTVPKRDLNAFACLV